MSDKARIGNMAELEELADPGGAFREVAFGALVGLAAKHSGGTALLGDTAVLAAEAYRKSLIGRAFPSFWMEVPLSGNPGFDLHVYYDRGKVLPGERFASGCGFGMQALFDWFFGVETGGVGVGFAHDLRDGSDAVGAYVNFYRKPLVDERGFFASFGAAEAYDHVAKLLSRLPSSWGAWYFGIFPDRPGAGVRVGLIVSAERQAAYAADTRAIADDLAQVGFMALDGRMLEHLSAMAASPFTLELQLDVTEEGVGNTLGADLALNSALTAGSDPLSLEDSNIERAYKLLEAWDMADSRWRRIAEASMSDIVPLGGEEEKALFLFLTCAPAFIKAKWVLAQPQPAKVYLICATRLLGSQTVGASLLSKIVT